MCDQFIILLPHVRDSDLAIKTIFDNCYRHVAYCEDVHRFLKILKVSILKAINVTLVNKRTSLVYFKLNWVDLFIYQKIDVKWCWIMII